MQPGSHGKAIWNAQRNGASDPHPVTVTASAPSGRYFHWTFPTQFAETHERALSSGIRLSQPAGSVSACSMSAAIHHARRSALKRQLRGDNRPRLQAHVFHGPPTLEASERCPLAIAATFFHANEPIRCRKAAVAKEPRHKRVQSRRRTYRNCTSPWDWSRRQFGQPNAMPAEPVERERNRLRLEQIVRRFCRLNSVSENNSTQAPFNF